MSAKRIRDLPVASSVGGTDLLEIEQGGTSKQAQASLIGSGGQPADAHYLVATSDPDLSNQVNLGGMNSGILKSSVSAGVATITPTQMPYTVNVKDAPYSATGDGVTDDTTAIQTAITDVFNSGGGTIYFPKGTYLCNGAFDGTTNSVLKLPYNDPSSNGVISIALVGEVHSPWITNLTSSLSGGVVIKSTKTGSGTRPSILAGKGFVSSPGVTDFNAVFLSIKGITFRTYDDPSIDALQLHMVCRVNLEDVAVDTGTQTPSEPTHGTIGIDMPATSNFAASLCTRVVVQGYDHGIRVGEHFTSVYSIIAYCHVGLVVLNANDQAATGTVCILWCTTFVRFDGEASVDLNLDLERAVAGPWYATGNDIDGITNFNHGSGVIRYALSNSATGRITGPLTVNAPGDCLFIDQFNGHIRWNGDIGLQRDSSVGGGVWVTDGTPSNFRELTARSIIHKGVTVANLPASPSIGQVAAVTDGTASLAWGATVTGGGSTKYLVWYNGANWTVAGK